MFSRFPTATCLSISVSALLLCAALAGAVRADTAVTVDGRVIEGRIEQAGDKVTFAAAGSRYQLSQLARIETGVPFSPVTLASGIETADGSILRGAVRIESDGRPRLDCPRVGETVFDASQAAAVFLRRGGEGLPVHTPGVLLANGDFLKAEAVVLKSTSVSVGSIAGDLVLPIDRVVALRLRAAEASAAPVQLVLDNGDVVNGDLESASATAFRLSAPWGTVEIERRSVAAVEFPARRRYLSDASPAFSTQGFAPEGPVYWSIDRAPDGALEGGGRVFRKGFFARAGVVVTVALPKGSWALLFTPVLAEGSNPSVGVFRVGGGGRTLWQKTLSGDAKPEAVSVAVKGLETIQLEFQSDPPGLLGAAGVWGDAFVTVEEGK